MSTDVIVNINYAGHMDGEAILNLQDPQCSTLVFEPHNVKINDIRKATEQFTLESSGFCFAKHETSAAIDPVQVFVENADRPSRISPLSVDYLDDVAVTLKAITGAREIVPVRWGLLVRAAKRPDAVSKNNPANFVHLDFTPSAAAEYSERALAKAKREPLPYSRWAIYQTWSVVSSGPQDSTLAMCDARTVSKADSVVFQTLGVDGSRSEARVCKYAPEHRWYYLSNMEQDDIIVFKGFDSGSPDAMNAMHTAFDNPLVGVNPPPRRSIEGRFIALFD